jgi:hypothetical protein
MVSIVATDGISFSTWRSLLQSHFLPFMNVS